LPEKERLKWEKKAEKDKLRYQEEMTHYTPPDDFDFGGGGGGKKAKKAKKDPNAPKRNMSAYFLYSVANRADVKTNNPDASFGDIAKIISQQFKALSEKERAKWDAKAEADKTRYQQEMEIYNN
jgi:high mobility group protein B2